MINFEEHLPLIFVSTLVLLYVVFRTVKKHPPSVLRHSLIEAISRNPSYKAKIFAQHERNQKKVKLAGTDHSEVISSVGDIVNSKV